ncbi:MAG: DUF2135 domain-containing protein [Fibromonadaceae bacterium]|nr:DUF2135 domain-containing protein [Fibromonadaceae bacterium]
MIVLGRWWKLLVFLVTALISCSPTTANNVKKQQNAVASSVVLSQAKLPVLNIDGKKSADVYLQSLDIQVEVTGNIAFTRYTMVFKNKTSKVLEGELTFPLPDGRTVTHYALDINGSMREAVPVEKTRATQVFEEIQQREVDPGILERVEGNNFRTRIYPIPGNGTRTISVGYEEELTLENNLLYYRLPMAYSDSLEKFAVKATVFKSNQKPLVPKSEEEISFDMAGENYVAALARENYQPSGSLIFTLPTPADIPQIIMQPAQGSHYFLAAVTPKMATRKKQWDNNLAIIWDVSLSASQRNWQKEIEMLNILFAKKKKTNIHLYFLNNKFKKIESGSWDKLKNILETAVFDGGTDFSQINLNDIAGKEILFFSDGISTLSDADFLKNANEKRPVHSIVSTPKADYSTMRLIASKTKGKFINLNALSSEQLKDELLNETLQFLGTEHENVIREVYPSIASPVYGNFSVAGISDKNNAELTLLFGFGDKVEKKIKVKLDSKSASSQGNIYRVWAQKKITELDLNYEENHAELTELGKQFGIVTRNTSLIVLEFLDDYIRYDIEPPATEPKLQDEYWHWQKNRGEQRRNVEYDMLKEAVAIAEDLKKWWNNDFTLKKPKYPTPDNERLDFASSSSNITPSSSNASTRRNSDVDAVDVVGWMDNPSAVFVLDGPASSSDFNYSRAAKDPTITIKPIKKDNEYLSKLTGKASLDYQIYLTLRNDYANSPTFYFDMADWFYKMGDKETALRILTSIADLELENASLYKLLGYKLKEYGEYTLQKFIYQKVIQWRPMEPQSYRDYALALADNGEFQAALDSLYGVLTRTYSGSIKNRSRGIEEVVVTEINQLISKNPNLNTSQIDKRLLINIPVDIRVVINWNINNIDIDLHVRDPNNVECFYKNKRTDTGGRISADNRSGYGPEQFMLKKAVKGKYQVYVNYFSAREFAVDGPLTIMAEIFTKYADKTERREVVSLQMPNAKKKDGKNKKVEVAEFEF